MDLRTALKRGIAQLRTAEVPSFTLAAELLLLHVLARDRTWLYAHPEEPLSEADSQRFLALLARRAAGEPTQHLTGKQEFWGLEFEVTPEVLIPRPETEHVIEVALDRLALREVREGRRQTTKGEGLGIADVGTGSGCIAVALAKELPAARAYATDISAAALEVARRNAARHRVADRIQFVLGNLLDGIGDAASVGAAQHAASPPDMAAADSHRKLHSPLLTRLPRVLSTGHSPLHLDLIASNPPYIGRREATSLPREVRDHEPDAALYGGDYGHELYAPLIAQAAQHLKSGGTLVLELGHDSLAAVQPLLNPSCWTKIAVTEDLAGIPRVIVAEKM